LQAKQDKHSPDGSDAAPVFAPIFVIEGDWTIYNVEALEKSITDWKKQHHGKALKVDPSGLAKLDTAGAWLIHKHLFDAQFTAKFTEHQQALLDFVPEKLPRAPHDAENYGVTAFFNHIGEKTVEYTKFAYDLLAFTGVVFARMGKNIFHPSRFRLPSIVRHIEETGLKAAPIISLLAFGISLVIFYQGATQLKKFGADIYTIDLTVISLLREMAALTTAIMVAGRSGSAFAAEIGVMKLRGEVDALQTMGIDPVEALVVPRLLALLVTLPLLTFLAVAVGLAGGGVMSLSMLDMSWPQYIDRIEKVATPTMFFIGMIKAPVLAFLISSVCTYQGMHVKGSAEDVGKLTTLAVVQSIFLVIMADAVFSIVFSNAGL
jgi:phospholipid/cholesterol/gamma-HCH transport system permease protein